LTERRPQRQRPLEVVVGLDALGEVTAPVRSWWASTADIVRA
jgi:hypothetical protein